MRITSGVTDQYIYFVAVDSTDFTSRETGFSSFTVYRSRDGAAAAAMTTPTINETDNTNMPGVYELLLDEDMTIGAGNDTEEMAFHITHAGMAPVTRTIELYRSKITAGYTLGVESDGDLTQVNTVANQVTADVTAISGDTTAANNAESFFDGTGYAGTNNVIPTVTTVGTTTTNSDLVTAATIANAVWDEAAADHTAAGSTGLQLDSIEADTNELQTDDIPTLIAALPTAVENRTEMDSNSTQLAAIVADTNELQTDDVPGLIAALNDPTAATIADAVWDELATGHTDAGKAGQQLWTDVDAILADTNELQSDDVPTLIAALPTAVENRQEMDSNSTQLTAIVADTNELQTDDVPGLIAALNDPTAAVIADAVWDEAIADHAGVGSTGEALAGATAPTATAVADAVWDEATAGHVGAGSVGKAIVDTLADTNELQGNQGNWATATTVDLNADQSAVTIGTVTTNTDLVTAAAVRTEMDANSTQLTAIVADTGELQTDWTNGGRLDLIIDAILADTNELQVDDVPGLIAALNDLSAAQVNTEVDTAFTTIMADSVPADGTIPTREQALYMINQFLYERATAGTTVTVKKVDGSTALMTLTLNNATTPTSITRAT